MNKKQVLWVRGHKNFSPELVKLLSKLEEVSKNSLQRKILYKNLQIQKLIFVNGVRKEIFFYHA